MYCQHVVWIPSTFLFLFPFLDAGIVQILNSKPPSYYLESFTKPKIWPTSVWLKFLNLLSATSIYPISMFLLLREPSKPSFNAIKAIWIASSLSKSSLYLFSKKILPKCFYFLHVDSLECRALTAFSSSALQPPTGAGTFSFLDLNPSFRGFILLYKMCAKYC